MESKSTKLSNELIVEIYNHYEEEISLVWVENEEYTMRVAVELWLKRQLVGSEKPA